MLSEAVIKRVLEETLENEYWREVYENAPTEKCKRYWELAFCRTAGIKKEISQEMYDEVLAESDKNEEELGIEDWEYLRKESGPDRFSADCKKRIEELKARGEQ